VNYPKSSKKFWVEKNNNRLKSLNNFLYNNKLYISLFHKHFNRQRQWQKQKQPQAQPKWLAQKLADLAFTQKQKRQRQRPPRTTRN
jgi:hypothetical protein